LGAQILTLVGLAAATILGSGHIRGFPDDRALAQAPSQPSWAEVGLVEEATPAPTEAPTSTPPAVATATARATPTDTATPTVVATATRAPSATPTEVATASPTASAPTAAPATAQQPAPTVVYPIGPPPVRLVIPAIDVDIPVITVGTVKQSVGGQTYEVWDTVADAAAYHKTSAPPGYIGNTVLNGHRDIHGAVFADLDKVQIGDPITMFTEEHEFTYTVTEILVVPEKYATAAQRAENQRLIGYFPEERLTLVTCTPYGTNLNRLLIIAKPAGQMPQS